MNITLSDIEHAARRIGCHPAVILAIINIETPYPHVGDVEEGKPLILNERHWFYKLTGDVPVSKDYPKLAFPRSGGYCTGKTWRERQECEHKRLEKKLAIFDGQLREPALKSISMGLFQVMGFNHNIIGYNNVEDMWSDAKIMDDSIDLGWFVEFVKANGLDDELQREDFHGFARGYNGPAYRKNRYHIKIKELTDKFREKFKQNDIKIEKIHEVKPFIPIRKPLTGLPDFSQQFQNINT